MEISVLDKFSESFSVILLVDGKSIIHNKNLSKELKQRDIFFLFGEMGVGKTTFVKYLINSLQNRFKQKKTEVTSPTFNIMNEYDIDGLLIKHYDLYRLKSISELKDLNIFDENDNAILFIEWPQIIKEKPNLVTKLYFEYDNFYEYYNYA